MVCCLKGIWGGHPYTVTPTKLAPDLRILGHLWIGNDAIASWSRPISTSDHFKHPCETYTTCLSHCYFVSRSYGCTLIPLHWPSWSQTGQDLGIQGHLWSENDVTLSCLRLIYTSDHLIHPYSTYTKCLSHRYAVSMAHEGTHIPLQQPSWPQTGPDLGIQGHLWSENDVIASCLRLISTTDLFIHPY